MKTVTVYMGPRCSYCDAAKRLLTRNDITYKEINIALEEGKMDEMLKKSKGRRTIPQIFFDDHHFFHVHYFLVHLLLQLQIFFDLI